MLYYTMPQAWEFAAMLLAGAFMGVISLGFTWLRRLMRAGVLLCLACDLFMGLSWAIVACLALTFACLGRIRFFHVLGMALGAFLFLAAASPFARAIGLKCARLARAAARALMKHRAIRALLK